jgi:hypothetical protein
MKYTAEYGFNEIISWLPYEERAHAVWDFLLTGNCYIERIERPHILPEYRLVR